MKHLGHGPNWWTLYLLCGLTTILLFAAHFAFAEATARHLAQISIVLIGYGLTLAWLRSQATAIERERWVHHDESAHDHDLPIAEQQSFYRLRLSRHGVVLQSKEEER